jgi:S1-C subfamily serine protease
VAPEQRPSLDADGVLDAARPSIVIVECLDRRRNVVAQGSGVIVAAKTVATSWPLVSRAFAIRIRRGDETRPASISAVLESHGLARLRVEIVGTPIGLGRDAPPGPGATVHSTGFAQGVELSGTEGIVTIGAEGTAADVERIVTAKPLPAGFTGGGLLDSHGELIGILASSRAGDTLGLAVPVRYAKDLLALPEGTFPRVATSPLLRLPAADRKWLVEFMTGVARGTRPMTGLGLERVNALLDRLDPLVGAELEWVRVELGLGLLSHQRLFWEDAIEARTFQRFVKSAPRAEVEKRLVALGILSQRDVADADRMMRAIAAHEAFDVPGARVDATERYLTQMVSQVDQTKRRVETQLWEARSR